MPFVTTAGLGAATGICGTILGIINIVWAVHKERIRLRVEVDWDRSEMYDPEPEPSPHVTIFNDGSRVAYIDQIYLTKAEVKNGFFRNVARRFKATVHDNERIYTFASLENCELKPDTNLPRQFFWDEDDSRMPEISCEWQELRVIVRTGSGREWQSKAPAIEPSWFFRTRHMPAILPGVDPSMPHPVFPS